MRIVKNLEEGITYQDITKLLNNLQNTFNWSLIRQETNSSWLFKTDNSMYSFVEIVYDCNKQQIMFLHTIPREILEIIF